MRFPGFALAVPAVCLIAAATLAACGGGSHAPATPAVATQNAKAATLSIVLTLPSRTSSSVKRMPQYVSAATLGAKVTVNIGSTSQNVYSLAPGAGTCSTSSGANVCTLNVIVPHYGTGSISVALYDTAPVSGNIPSGAALLSSGTVAATVTEGQANVTLPVSLAGIAEGFTAGNPSTLSSGGTPSQGTFVMEAVDNEANLILDPNGAADHGGNTLSLQLVVPSAVTGVTLLDLTTNPTGTPSASITGVHVGDQIQVATSGTTQSVLGVPIAVYDATSTAIGAVHIPTNTGGSPIAVNTSYPGAGVEIAGVPEYASFDGTLAGSGFLYLTSSGLTGLAVNYALHVGITKFGCSFGGNTINHVAMGSGQDIIEALTSSTDVTLNVVPVGGGTCASGLQVFSTQSQHSLGPGNIQFNDVATDGTFLAAAEQEHPGSNGLNFLAVSTYTGGAGELTIGSAGTQARVDSVQAFYEKATVLASGTTQAGYRNSSFTLALFNLPASSPVATATDGAGHLFVLYNDAAGTITKCTLGATVSCATIASVAAYLPSYDHRSLALGADGKLYIATTTGLLQYDYIASTDSTIDNISYKQVVASGDGHVYALRTSGSSVSEYP